MKAKRTQASNVANLKVELAKSIKQTAMNGRVWGMNRTEEYLQEAEGKQIGLNMLKRLRMGNSFMVSQATLNSCIKTLIYLQTRDKDAFMED